MQKNLYVVGGGDQSDFIACKRWGGGVPGSGNRQPHHAETYISTHMFACVNAPLNFKNITFRNQRYMYVHARVKSRDL